MDNNFNPKIISLENDVIRLNDRFYQIDARQSRLENMIGIYDGHSSESINREIGKIKSFLMSICAELRTMCEDSDLNFITFKKLNSYTEKFEEILYDISSL